MVINHLLTGMILQELNKIVKSPSIIASCGIFWFFWTWFWGPASWQGGHRVTFGRSWTPVDGFIPPAKRWSMHPAVMLHQPKPGFFKDRTVENFARFWGLQLLRNTSIGCCEINNDIYIYTYYIRHTILIWRHWYTNVWYVNYNGTEHISMYKYINIYKYISLCTYTFFKIIYLDIYLNY